MNLSLMCNDGMSGASLYMIIQTWPGVPLQKNKKLFL